MIWNILISISLIVNVWAVHRILELTAAIDNLFHMFDTTKDFLEVVKDKLKEVEG